MPFAIGSWFDRLTMSGWGRLRRWRMPKDFGNALSAQSPVSGSDWLRYNDRTAPRRMALTPGRVGFIMDNGTIITSVASIVTLLVVLGGGFYWSGRMSNQVGNLSKRIDSLEEGLTTHRTEMRAIRDELKGEIVSLRTEVGSVRDELKGEIVSLRTEMHAIRDELRAEMHSIRDELKGEIDALRTELHAIRDELRAEMHAIRDELRAEMHAIRDELRAEMHAIRDELKGEISALRTELHSVRDELRGEIAFLRTEMYSVRDEVKDEIRISEQRVLTGVAYHTHMDPEAGRPIFSLPLGLTIPNLPEPSAADDAPVAA